MIINRTLLALPGRPEDQSDVRVGELADARSDHRDGRPLAAHLVERAELADAAVLDGAGRRYDSAAGLVRVECRHPSVQSSGEDVGERVDFADVNGLDLELRRRLISIEQQRLEEVPAVDLQRSPFRAPVCNLSAASHFKRRTHAAQLGLRTAVDEVDGVEWLGQGAGLKKRSKVARDAGGHAAPAMLKRDKEMAEMGRLALTDGFAGLLDPQSATVELQTAARLDGQAIRDGDVGPAQSARGWVFDGPDRPRTNALGRAIEQVLLLDVLIHRRATSKADRRRAIDLQPLSRRRKDEHELLRTGRHMGSLES